MEPDFDISAWVKEARAHWGKSQEALGELMGKTKGNISAWELGRHEPSFKQVLQISAITGWPLPETISMKAAVNGNGSEMIEPDELADLIRGYYKANSAERDAISRIIRAALGRAKAVSSSATRENP